MYFRILHDDNTGEFTYLLADPLAGEAVLIDPRARDLPVLTALLAESELLLRWVLRTHNHDHQKPMEAQRLATLGAPLVQGDSGPKSHPVVDGELLAFGSEALRVMRTPGHTHACLSFAWRDRLFCGGLLAVQACPSQPFPAEPQQLWDSVTQHIFTQPDETLLFTCHDRHARAVSTVQEQRRWHPLFAKLTRDEYLTQMADLPQQANQPSTV
jgi:glyoxylase-like metal-dependent hydrolase (beta-lactamase superfamily II)